MECMQVPAVPPLALASSSCAATGLSIEQLLCLTVMVCCHCSLHYCAIKSGERPGSTLVTSQDAGGPAGAQHGPAKRQATRTQRPPAGNGGVGCREQGGGGEHALLLATSEVVHGGEGRV